MVEVFVIQLESVEKGNKGYLSRNTEKRDDGIHVEYIDEIEESNPKSDICVAVAYFTRSSAIKTKDLILSEIINKHPKATINAEVKAKQISLEDSRRLNQCSWSYK